MEKGVPDKCVMIVQDMHEGARTRASTNDMIKWLDPSGRYAVGLPQESSMSPYIFAMSLDVLASRIKDLSPLCMIFAEHIVLCSTRGEEIEKKLRGG